MKKPDKKLNVKIDTEENLVSIELDSRIYSLDVVYAACYVFIDRAYILIKGNPKRKIIVDMQPKNKEEINKIGLEFNNELLNYMTYKTLSEKTKVIRQIILQRALLTNDPKLSEELFDEEIDDFEKISKPWSE